MNPIVLKLNPNGKSAFVIEDGQEKQAVMEISIDDQNITVYHTEVSPALRGQNVGTHLITAMVAYAREHHLKVIPLCPFVSAEFKRHSELYADVWNQSWH